jgi:hypothetical protein
VSAGTTYYYKVSAVASDGSESPQSDNAFATFTGEIQVPAVSLQAALDWLDSNAEDGGAYAITLKSNESIAPRTLSYGSKIVSVTLKGDTTERRISLSTNGSLFTVASGITLTLDSNVTLQGWSGNTASLIQVNSGGTLVMNTGSKISGNSASYGGGAYVSSNGTFTMNSGEISGNTASDGGGGVYADGMFTMIGGEISGNSGGGVYVSSNGTFTMESGEISDNTAGSGVQIVNSTFTMNNGEISGNSAIFGGGVYVSSGTFTMDGGEISGNSASSNGGGVYIITGTFTMKGGEISGNSASSDGGGVYGWSISTFIKQPNAVIYGSNANNPWKNTAGDGRGHAVYFVSNKQRNTTAGMGVTLNSSKSGAAGGWE